VSTTVITVVLLQNCIDSRSGKLGSHSALCATSSEFGNELICVQVEGITEMTEGENHEVMTSLISDPGVDLCLWIVYYALLVSKFANLYIILLCKTGVWFCEVIMAL